MFKINESFVSAELSISPEEKYRVPYDQVIFIFIPVAIVLQLIQWRIWKREFLCKY